MNIIWTAKAEHQLDHIFEYISPDSECYAYRLVNQIISKEKVYPNFQRKANMFQSINAKIFVKSLSVLIV